MDLASQMIAYDKTVRSDTVHDLKEFNNQSLATQAKKAFKLIGDDIVELSTENYALRKDR